MSILLGVLWGWSSPSYGLFLNNTLNNLEVPHRAQFNLMIGFKPRAEVNESAFTSSLSANYQIMGDTTAFVESPNFLVSSKSGSSFFPEVGGGLRHRFRHIPDQDYDLDILGAMRFPNHYIVFSPGGALVAYWYGMTWYLEPGVDFIFPNAQAPKAGLTFKFDVEYPMWTWVTLHLAMYRAAGIHFPFYPVAITNPDTVVEHLFFANFGIQIRINERVLGHVETALGVAAPARNGNLTNVIIGAQYLL